MKKAVLLVAVLLLVLPFTALSAQESLIESVCFVTDTAGVNDGGFNSSAFDGMEMASEEFDLETTVIESGDAIDYEPNVELCVTEGYDAVITVGFLLTDTTFAAAQANPDVYFVGIDQGYAEALPNLVSVTFREDQAGFLVGAMAALMTESGIIGGVYGIDIPPVVKFRNGYEQGALYINPDIVTIGAYIDSFDAADRGRALAEQLIGEGADVIFGAGGPTGSGGIGLAAAEGVWAIGVDKDEYFTTFGEGETPGAEYLISSAMKRIDQGVYQMLALLANGEMFPESGSIVLDAANEGVGFAPAHDAEVPEEVTAQIEEILAGLADGSIETGVDPASGMLMSEMEMEMTPEATPGS